MSRDVQQLIATMAGANRTWGEERIANELLLKRGIRLSPRTVRRYMTIDSFGYESMILAQSSVTDQYLPRSECDL